MGELVGGARNVVAVVCAAVVRLVKTWCAGGWWKRRRGRFGAAGSR
jgi:hypothetical protein